MKLANKKKRDFDDDSLLPLVNIIFLLLIFFMIAGVIEKRFLKDDIEPPSAKLSKFENKEITKIFIDKDNIITFNDKIMNVSEIDVILKKENNKDFVIIADKSLYVKNVYKVLDTLNKNKVKNIKLLSITNAN